MWSDEDLYTIIYATLYQYENIFFNYSKNSISFDSENVSFFTAFKGFRKRNAQVFVFWYIILRYTTHAIMRF